MKSIKRITSLLAVIVFIVASVSVLSSCSLKERFRTFDTDEDGIDYYLSHDGEAYYVKGGDSEELVIPEEFKGKPVIGSTEDSYTDPAYKTITLPSSFVYVGPNSLTYREETEYNRYGGGYYLGSPSNPYLLLVYTDGGDIKIADGCRSIADGAISSKVTSLEISASVEFISRNAFKNASTGVGNDASGVKRLEGFTRVTVSPENENYVSVGDYMVLNKEKTRLVCLVVSQNMMIPASVEFAEESALCPGSYSYYSGSKYIPSENNPKFILTDAQAGIEDGVEILATYACYIPQSSFPINIPDSVRQVMPKCFHQSANYDQITVSDDWYNASDYYEGRAYDMAISAYKKSGDSGVLVYLSEGREDQILATPNFDGDYESDFRRYAD